MIRLSEIFQQRKFVLSIEIFPPKTEEGDATLRKHLDTLVRFDPAFISCTYGAGGSTRDRTLHWCRIIQEELSRPAMAHFTCVGSTRAELIQWLGDAAATGVCNIMALRGDPQAGQTTFRAEEGGLSHASELVALIQEVQPSMNMGVAGYPEKHIEAPSLEADLKHLKQKVDAGAHSIFTQLFFQNENFFSFRDRCEALGITIPIVPGIMPITDFARIKRIVSMCGTVFPEDLSARLERVKEDAAAQFEIGVEHAIQQCEALKRAGVPGIHFYALNKSDACQKILEAIQ